MVVDAVLRVRGPGRAEDALVVRLVLAEEERRSVPVGPHVGVQLERTEEWMLGLHDAPGSGELGLLAVDLPRPGVAVPGRRQDVERVGLGSLVRDPNGEEEVVGVGLCVVGLDDPVAVVVEDPRVEQLELRILLAPGGVFLDECLVGKRSLRVVVAPPVPGVRRCRIEVPPVLLGVLAVVSLVAGEPEDSLLQDRVAPVPEREPQAEELLDVREAGEPVLPPAIGP